MSAESLAYATLVADGAVAALVGTRVYPDFVPQEQALPAVALSRVGTEYLTTIHAAAPTGEIASLDVWCMAETRIAAETLADTVLAALAPAGFLPLERRPEFDAEANLYAAVITVQVLVQF